MTQLNYFDSHAHLTCLLSEKMSKNDLNGMIQEAKEIGVTQIANICTDRKSLLEGVELAKINPSIINVAATTPHDIHEEGKAFFEDVRKAAKAGQLHAIGETGLDYFYEHAPKKAQQESMIQYFELALEFNLPIVIHCRDAFKDFFQLLDLYYLPKAKKRGILHCFTGTLDEAKECVKRGLYVSLSGIITFKRSQELREVAREIPLSHLLIETDTPYLAPVPYRGKTNQPAYVVEVARCIADQKATSLEEVAQATLQNACNLFDLMI